MLPAFCQLEEGNTLKIHSIPLVAVPYQHIEFYDKYYYLHHQTKCKYSLGIENLSLKIAPLVVVKYSLNRIYTCMYIKTMLTCYFHSIDYCHYRNNQLFFDYLPSGMKKYVVVMSHLVNGKAPLYTCVIQIPSEVLFCEPLKLYYSYPLLILFFWLYLLYLLLLQDFFLFLFHNLFHGNPLS